MATMDRVKQINSDIAALPAEYRSLIQAEKKFATQHPVLYAGALILLGVVVGLAIAWVL